MLPASTEPFDTGPFDRWRAAEWRRPGGWSTGRRAVLAAAIAWVPLIVLAAVEGLLVPPSARESILLDVTVYARYLVAVPLLVAAEALTLPRLAGIAHHFIDGGFVAERDRPRYEAVTASVRRLLGHRGVAPALIVLAYAAAGYRIGYAPEHGGWLVPRRESWFAVVIDGERVLTLAGWWTILVSHPLFLILAEVWVWRVIVWTRFLWGMSRLDLRLVPAHPDRAAGLYFTSDSVRAFAFVAIAFSTAFAGVIAEEVLEFGRAPEDFRHIVLGVSAMVVALFAAPLVVFAGILRRVRTRGPLEYGRLAALVGRVYEARWLRPDAPIAEALSQPDFSATVDLYDIVAKAQQIRLVPIGFGPLATLVFGALLPYLLVAIVALPIDRILEVLQRLLL